MSEHEKCMEGVEQRRGRKVERRGESAGEGEKGHEGEEEGLR